MAQVMDTTFAGFFHNFINSSKLGCLYKHQIPEIILSGYHMHDFKRIKPVLFTWNHLESKPQSFNVIYFLTLGISSIIFISIHFLVHLLFYFASTKFVVILFFFTFDWILFQFYFHFHCLWYFTLVVIKHTI